MNLPENCGGSHSPLPRQWGNLFGRLAPVLERVLALDRLQRLYEEASCAGAEGILERAVGLLRVEYQIESGSLDWIPRSGPVVVTANHPFGLLEGAILVSLLRRVRPDVRILANSILAAIPELREVCIFADPFGLHASVAANASALKECLGWLNRGGLLAAFPAGEVAHRRWTSQTVRDSEWNPAVARLAQRTGATAVPLHFGGKNSMMFQLASLLHPMLRTLQLPRELLNKTGKTIGIRVGHPVPSATLRACPATCAIEHLRRRTDLLAREAAPQIRPVVRQEPIAEAIDPALLAGDVAALPDGSKLAEGCGLSVWLGRAEELPHVLREIGRLREIAFRAAGEGSGHSRDLDRFDPHYLHLFLWNAATREVAGAYRLACTTEIIPRLGSAGLYTSTLFRYRRELFERIGPAIELGRSFVHPRYQKQFAPLLLLWKGISRYAALRPECTCLFGAASISNAYLPESRDLMVRMLHSRQHSTLAPLVSGRNPYRASPLPSPDELEGTSKLVADMEPDGKGLPILLKQYLKAGAKVLAFNVDPAFSNSLDVLVLVDLRESAAALQARLQADSSTGSTRPVTT